MQNWTDLYKELAEKISTEMPAIRWVDLWHNQVNFLETEHPFPTPAVFISFRTKTAEDMGEKVQNLTLQIDFYLFYETFADTYRGAINEDYALEFLKSMETIHSLFHGTAGENYSSMRRLGFAPVDTGGAGNLYQISFECILVDYSAMKKYNETENLGQDITLEPFNENGFIVY